MDHHAPVFAPDYSATCSAAKMTVKATRDKRSYLVSPTVSKEENKVLCIQYKGPYTQHFIFFITKKWPKIK
jgi:hypothetical protein